MGTVTAHAQSTFPTRFHGFRLAIPRVDWFLQDGEYAPQSPATQLEASLVSALSSRQLKPIANAINDVTQELKRQFERNSITHIVIYGSNRKIVAAKILLNCAITGDVVLVLSESELARETLIAKRINHELTPNQISRLPVNLEEVKSNGVDLPEQLINALYSDNRLVGPYQIDTDRYPFAKCFV
jgi:hypothetical protein